MKNYIMVLLLLLSFNNSFSQWIVQPVPDDINVILSMDFTDSQNGAGVGNSLLNNFSGTAIYTTNAGNNWISAIVPDSSFSLSTIQFINSATGYSSGTYNLFFNDNDIAAGKNNSNVFSSGHFRRDYDMVRGIKTKELENYRGLFFKTTDGGRIWNTFGNVQDSIYHLHGLHFINPNTGFTIAAFNYLSGVDVRIIKTTNGGSSWIQLPMPGVVNNLNNIFFTDDNNGYAVGYKVINDTPRAAILKTINSGASWTLQLFTDILNFTDINFSNSTTGFIIGDAMDNTSANRSVIHKTTNAGINWNLLPLDFSDIFLQSIKFVPGTGVGFACGMRIFMFSSTRIFTTKTTDYGATWSNQVLNDSGSAMNNFLLDQQSWYISIFDGDHSYMLHSTNGGTGISTVNNSLPDDFQLYQNYPNPFNPSTKIKFQISETASVNLIVYDVLGKEIKTIVNDRLMPGTYEAEFDGYDLTSGIYFYHLKIHPDKISSGEFSEVRKMLLIK